MADDTKKPAEEKPMIPIASTMAATSAKSSATKPAARAKTAPATAPAVRRRATATAKTAASAAKKIATRSPVARKSTPAKKAAHEPEPFAAKVNKADKPAKAKKAKLVRDSFTMPDGEYALIATLKKRFLDVGVAAKKSEILRAAVANLAKLSDAAVVAAVRRLEVIKTGRPAKGSK